MNVLDAAAVQAALTPAAAVDALEAALRDGLDVDADPPRTRLPVAGGELLVMPSVTAGAPVVKLVTVGGDPRVQGGCLVFDPGSLAPVALLDGPALTALRTAAVSALAVRHLAAAGPRRLLVFGRGPQGRAHAEAVRATQPLERVDVVGRDGHPELDALVAAADVICCCTTTRTPLFDGAQVADGAVVVAIGSHEPDAREVDDALARRATVVVESVAAARREAGDIRAAVAAGALELDALVPLADVVTGRVTADPDRPRLFKGTGMAWQDAVVAAAVVVACA